MEIPGYEVLAKIGEGGMGAVYRARSRTLGRLVAVKFLAGRGGAAGDGESRRRFEREAQAVARLNHRHIVQLYEYHPEADPPYFVMELVDGVPLSSALPPLSLRLRAELLERIARAVHYAHERGLVHRDLKPTNILVDAAREPKILDFGLARLGAQDASRLTQSGAVVGTPAYTSPEQARGRPDVGPEADVFALGAILYEAITGTVPFPAESTLAMLQRIAQDDPVFPRTLNPDCPEPLQRVCLAALEKSPAHRYRSALDLAEDLHRFLAGATVLARPTLYVNVLAGRVQTHVDDLARWREENLLSQREYDGLRGRYEDLLSEEAEWIGHSRRITGSLAALYLGGWLTVIASALWLHFFWEQLTPGERVASVAIPAAILNVAGALLWGHQGRRAAVAFLMSGALLLPAAFVVVLSQFHWLELRAGEEREFFDAGYCSNFQLLAALGIASLYYLAAARWTRSTAFALLLALGGLGVYAAQLARWGLKAWLAEASFAWSLGLVLPAAAAYQGIGWALDRQRLPRYATPFLVSGGALLLAALSGLALYAPRDWGHLQARDLELAVKLAFMANGLLYFVAARTADRHGTPLLRRQAYVFYLLTPASFLIPLHLLEERGPVLATLGAAPVHLGECLLPCACLGFVLLSVPLQLKTFFYSGLLYLAIAAERVTDRHFLEARAWPLTLAVAGLSVMVLGLLLERRLGVPAGASTAAPGTPPLAPTRLRAAAPGTAGVKGAAGAAWTTAFGGSEGGGPARGPGGGTT